MDKFLAHILVVDDDDGIRSLVKQYLIENKFLEIPDHIKIDVDGIEHLILEGGNRVLNNKKIKSFSIEINEILAQNQSKLLNVHKDHAIDVKYLINHKNRAKNYEN